jgi:hypothetical protein
MCKTVDAKRVGIEGVSRYGKAVLVTMAFDQRFAMVLVGSSGKGGATPLRRNFGEALEGLPGGEYYWMAGYFIKYGASDASFGVRNADDGGHTDAPNMKYFIQWADKFIGHVVPQS